MKVKYDFRKGSDEARQPGYLWVSYAVMLETVECQADYSFAREILPVISGLFTTTDKGET